MSDAQAGLDAANNRMKKLLLTVLSAVFFMLQLPAVGAEESGFIENRQCFGCHKSQKQTYLDSIHGRAFSADTTSGCQKEHGLNNARADKDGEWKEF